ncbi:MAG: DUF4249 family protein [Lentimicrobium sp.]
MLLIKKVKQCLIFGLAIITAVYSAGCRKLVESENQNFTPAPVINSIIKAGEPLNVHVSIASKFNDLEIKGIDNAVVNLFADDVFIEQMASVGDGNYVSETTAEPLKKYEYRVSVSGFSEAVCKALIPTETSISEIEHISVAGKDTEGMTYPAIKFTFHSIPSEEQYFEARIRLFQYESEYNADIINIVDPVLLNEGLPLTVFSNDLIQDTTYTMTINYITGSSSSTGGSYYTNLYPFMLEIRSISKDYYLFTRQKYLYDTGRFPEFGLSTNTAFLLYSNVENGYGIFIGYSAVVSDTIYPSY